MINNSVTGHNSDSSDQDEELFMRDFLKCARSNKSISKQHKEAIDNFT